MIPAHMAVSAGIQRPKEMIVPEYVPGTGGEVLERTRQKLKPPPMYRVLMHNDDYTTMEFVVEMLVSVFHKKTEDAVRIMLRIHKNGIGVCGVYTGDVAETKIASVHAQAQDRGYPLQCSMEPE